MFQFEAMDSAGAEVKDSIEAATEEDAQAQVRKMGYFVTKLTEIAGSRITDSAHPAVATAVIVFVIFLVFGFAMVADDSTAYRSGYKASKAGIEASANPYRRDQVMARRWLDGYRDAK